jgi:hypothetical protein
MHVREFDAHLRRIVSLAAIGYHQIRDGRSSRRMRRSDYFAKANREDFQ